MNGIRTFRHRFKGGATCEMVIDLDKLCDQQPDPQRCTWSRKPKSRVIPEYRRWILTVWQRVADETGLRTMEMLQVKSCLWEIWVFEPGKAPRKVDEIPTPAF
jgi:hypothetical protein